MLYQTLQVLIARPVARGVFRCTVEGLENIPATGGAVLASNHLGAVDPIITSTFAPRPVTYTAKAELFAGRGLGRRLVAWFLRTIHTVPVDRSGGRTSRQVFAPVLEVLARGGLVGIYPEGTRSPDGYLHKGKTGVARIALAADVPVVPLAIFDSQTVRRFGIPWLSRPRLVFGQPMTFHQFRDRHDDHDVLRYVTDEIMNAIMELSGQEYVDVYGSSVKSGAVRADDARMRVLPRPGGGPPPAITAGG